MKPEQSSDNLAREWRRLSRAATLVALLTSPVLFSLLYYADGWSLIGSLVVTLLGVMLFRGLIDILAHRLIPRPSLYGADKAELAEDARARRRVWYWRKKLRHTLWLAGTLFTLLLGLTSSRTSPATPTTWPARSTASAVSSAVRTVRTGRRY